MLPTPALLNHEEEEGQPGASSSLLERQASSSSSLTSPRISQSTIATEHGFEVESSFSKRPSTYHHTGKLTAHYIPPIQERGEDLEREARFAAGQVIGAFMMGMHRRRIFNRLKRAVNEAQKCLALDILRQLCPQEAQLLSDPTLRPIVRLRLGGASFPPHIYYKVFLKSEISSVQYFSGRKLIRPATEAAADAYQQMGKKKFMEQVLQDMYHARTGTFDELDVATLQDFIKASILCTYACMYMYMYTYMYRYIFKWVGLSTRVPLSIYIYICLFVYHYMLYKEEERKGERSKKYADTIVMVERGGWMEGNKYIFIYRC